LSNRFSGLHLAQPFPVNLRVDVIGLAGRRVVRAAGRLFGEDVAIFEQICNDEPLPFRIDLEELLSADQAGLAVLLRQKERGARFRRVPGYIRLRLASAAKLAGSPTLRVRRRRSGSDVPDASDRRRVP
jgi:hypothetical protein